MSGVSIGALKRSAEAWARSLRKQGFQVTVRPFRSGPGGAEFYGPSHVEVEVERRFAVAGEPREFFRDFRFLANGYGATRRSDVDGETWGDMKRKAQRDLAEAFAREHPGVRFPAKKASPKPSKSKGAKASRKASRPSSSDKDTLAEIRRSLK